MLNTILLLLNLAVNTAVLVFIVLIKNKMGLIGNSTMSGFDKVIDEMYILKKAGTIKPPVSEPTNLDSLKSDKYSYQAEEYMSDNDIHDDSEDKDVVEEIKEYINNNNNQSEATNTENDEATKYKLANFVDEYRIAETEAIDINLSASNTFKDLDEFLSYVYDYNVIVIDVVKNRIRKVVDLAKHTHNGKKTVAITFEDGGRAFFEPGLYAKYKV